MTEAQNIRYVDETVLYDFIHLNNRRQEILEQQKEYIYA